MEKLKKKWASLSIYSNSLLVLMKLVVGILTGSVSIISEAIHSSLDLIASIVTYISIRLSSKPADKEHRYGHGKFENIAGTFEAMLIFLAGVLIIIEAIEKLKVGGEMKLVIPGIIVMGIASIVNYFIAQKLLKIGKQTDSVALEGDGYHLLTDVYTSLGVFAGLIAIQLTGATILDPIIAIAVACYIIWLSIHLVKKSLAGLLDEKLPDNEEDVILQVVESYKKEIMEIHDLRTRKSGSHREIDFHLLFCKEMSVLEAHNVCDRIEADIGAKLERTHITIHIEPCGHSAENGCDESCLYFTKKNRTH